MPYQRHSRERSNLVTSSKTKLEQPVNSEWPNSHHFWSTLERMPSQSSTQESSNFSQFSTLLMFTHSSLFLRRLAKTERISLGYFRRWPKWALSHIRTFVLEERRSSASFTSQRDQLRSLCSSNSNRPKSTSRTSSPNFTIKSLGSTLRSIPTGPNRWELMATKTSSEYSGLDPSQDLPNLNTNRQQERTLSKCSRRFSEETQDRPCLDRASLFSAKSSKNIKLLFHYFL